MDSFDRRRADEIGSPLVRKIRIAPAWDRPAAVACLAVTALLAVVMLVLSGLNVRAPACPQDPSCNQVMMNVGAGMLTWLPPLIFLTALIITAARWKQQLPVFWVAVLALALVVVVFVLSSLLMSWAW